MEFKWMNESTLQEEGGKLTIDAPAQTDFFRSGTEFSSDESAKSVVENAPFYYTEVEGDFVLRVKVSHEFKDVYDAAAIMVMQDETCWAKSCYETSDFGTRAVVSVVTRGDSDDANGCNLEGDSVWLQMCRVGQYFAFHYSVDGERYDMMRYFTLPMDSTVKVGLVAQSPIGSGGPRYFEHLSIEYRTVENMRAGK